MDINDDDLSQRRKTQMEREANAFARALLMPEVLLRTDIALKGGKVTSQLLVELAERYCVEEHQMTLRLIELGFIKT